MSDACSIEPNADISGIGVRLSFYVQTFFLAMLSIRSPDSGEVTSALTTLIVTNMAYAVTTLVLGFVSSSNQLGLYDAMVVLYLLVLSWSAIFFTLPSYNRHEGGSDTVKRFTVVQSYLTFGTGFAVLASAPNFGSNPECNKYFSFVILAPFRVINAGRIVYLVLLAIVTAAYTLSLLIDYRVWESVQRNIDRGGWATVRKYRDALGDKLAHKVTSLRTQAFPETVFKGLLKHFKRPRRWATREKANFSLSDFEFDSFPIDTSVTQIDLDGANGISVLPGTTDSGPIPDPFGGICGPPAKPEEPLHYQADVDGRVLISMCFVVPISVFAIVNTELLRKHNNLSGDGSWTFGQILAVFMMVPTLWSTFHTFRKLGLREHKNNVDGKHKESEEAPSFRVRIEKSHYRAPTPHFGRNKRKDRVRSLLPRKLCHRKTASHGTETPTPKFTGGCLGGPFFGDIESPHIDERGANSDPTLQDAAVGGSEAGVNEGGEIAFGSSDGASEEGKPKSAAESV